MVSNFMMSNQKAQIIRSNPPGTKSQDFYKWSEQSLEEMDSTLAVQQYIQQMIRRDYTDTEAILKMPAGQDEGVWKYEQLRQFCLELNGLAVRLQGECKPDQCWQMTATDQWIFLCAAHKTPQECAAIDYTRHTLDGAACLLNSNKYFPSRVNIKESSVNKLGSVCRRVYRIFSHAYYHHRQVFDEAENETYLCRRFTTFVTKYELMSRENLIVPIFNDDSSVIGDSSTLQRNSDKRSSMVESPMFSIIKKPKKLEDKLPQFGIANILNLPPGVGPDDEDDDDEDETIDFPQELGEDENGDDDFSFTGGTTTNFGTMKPMKKPVVSIPVAGDDPTTTTDDAELDISESGDSSFIENPLSKLNNNSTTYLTLSADDESAAAAGDCSGADGQDKTDESDC